MHEITITAEHGDIFYEQVWANLQKEVHKLLAHPRYRLLDPQIAITNHLEVDEIVGQPV